MGCGASKVAPASNKSSAEAPSGAEKSVFMAPVRAVGELASSVTEMVGDVYDEAAKKIEAVQRGIEARKELEQQKKSAVVMQSLYRGRQARRQSEQLRVSRKIIETDTAELKKTKGKMPAGVNDYYFSKQLGKGAYGEVYKAHKGSKSSDDVSACKVLSRSILRRKRVGRFGSAYDSVMGEISVMKALDHPNIVRLYEVIDDPDEDLLFMVMELVTGGDLSAPFNEKRNVPEAELRVWLRGLTLGLEHLHLSGVCHRDIKPENLLWDPRYQQVSDAASTAEHTLANTIISYSLFLSHSKNTPVLLCLCVPGQADRLWHLRLRQDRYDGRRLFDIHGRLDALFRARDVQSAQWCGLFRSGGGRLGVRREPIHVDVSHDAV